VNPTRKNVAPDLLLRAAAEVKLAKAPQTDGRAATELLHDLQVHQIELEMQNEELRRTQQALQESRDRYVDLYEFAPVGYLSLSEDGLIARINLSGIQLLGRERRKLLQRPFLAWVAPEDHERWDRAFQNAMQSDGGSTTELTLQRGDGSVLVVQAVCARQQTDAGTTEVHMNLSDVTERKRSAQQMRELTNALQAKVSRDTQRLRTLSLQMTMAEERERQLLAEQLHDDLGQLLSVIKIKLTTLVIVSPVLQTQLAEVETLADQALESARLITRQLSPPTLHTLGLGPALQGLAEDFQCLHHLSVHTQIEAIPAAMNVAVRAVLYRSARELLINVVRHAEATEVQLYCVADDQQLTLAVSDDGGGFKTPCLCDDLPGSDGFGLRSISERIANFEGEMTIDSTPAKGSRVSLSVPLRVACNDTPTS